MRLYRPLLRRGEKSLEVSYRCRRRAIDSGADGADERAASRYSARESANACASNGRIASALLPG
ncbi:hypothetical protein BLAT2472_10393 [Burkholderia latens]